MITLSDPAKEQINQIIETNADQKGIKTEELFLRIYVNGGGCGGVQYGMAITSEKRDNDLDISIGDINILVDPMSQQYLEGASVEYIQHELGARFKINPPESLEMNNAGCGSGCSC